VKPSFSVLAALRAMEVLRTTAYLPTPKDRPTIGYGHTGPDVQMGMTITPEKAEELFREDVERVTKSIEKLVKVPLNQGQMDALTSFTFNVGSGALAGSTLLRLLNAGDFAGAAQQFPRWDKQGHQTLPGLVLRRAREKKAFESGRWD